MQRQTTEKKEKKRERIKIQGGRKETTERRNFRQR
jgi:hypothetical protein